MSQRDNAFGNFGEAEWTRASSISLGYSADGDVSPHKGVYCVDDEEDCTAIRCSDSDSEKTRSGGAESFKQGDSGAQKPKGAMEYADRGNGRRWLASAL